MTDANTNSCTATTRDGNPCRRKRERGSTVCQAHRPRDVIAKALDGIERPRCVRIKRNGERCKLPPIKGGTICKKHGGAAAHIQRKARERLQSMIVPALVELNKILQSPSTSESDKLRAIGMVLDRTGYGKESNVLHTVEVKPWEKTMETIITATPIEQPGEDIHDAEVIEDEPAFDAESEQSTAVGDDRVYDYENVAVLRPGGRYDIKASVPPPVRRRFDDDEF